MEYYNLNTKWLVIVPNEGNLVNEVKAFILHYYPNQYYNETIFNEKVEAYNVLLLTRPFNKEEFNDKFPNVTIKIE